MSAPFRRHADVGAHARPPGGPAPCTAGMGLTFAEFSAEVGGAAPDAGNDPALRLVVDAAEMSGERSPEDMVAYALDRPPWTALLVVAARDRRRRDALLEAAVEAAQRAEA